MSSSSSSSSPDYSTSASLGFPQLAICALVGFLVLRWFFSSAPSGVTTSGGIAGRARTAQPPRARVSQATVDMLQSMFPQVSGSAIRFELERNGGNVETITEKILSEGTLREPPVPATSSGAASRSTSATARTSQPQSRTANAARPAAASASTLKTTHSDLITRFNLQSRLSEPIPGTVEGKGKAVQKNDRANLMIRARERRDNLILSARRKMEEEIAKEKEAASSSS